MREHDPATVTSATRTAAVGGTMSPDASPRRTPNIERLRALDAEFLHLEDAESPLHIAGLCIFEGPALEVSELRQLIAARLDEIPRYRRRLQLVPFGLGRPVWVDDPAFDLQRHVQQTQLHGDDPEAALCELMGTLLSSPLDRTRPLWDTFLVHGLPDKRWALITRVHHAMVDGISGVELMRALLTEAPETPASEERSVVAAAAPLSAAQPDSHFSPSPLPGAARLIFHSLGGIARDARDVGRSLLNGLRDPAHAMAATGAVVIGLTRFTLRLYSRRTSSLQGPIGSRRRYAYMMVSLADLKEARHGYGCTLNDVVLCVLSGGYRALLEAQGDRVAQAHVRSLVPVSTRSTDARASYDNRVSAVLCELPVQVADPRERLRAISAQMTRLKHAHMVEAGVWFTHVADFVPPLLVGAISRRAARFMHKHPQRIISTITTNVPGPRQPLYLLGRRLVHWLPHVPITQGVRLASACLSYADELAFGITADHASFADLKVFTNAVAQDLAALLSALRAREPTTSEQP